MISSSKTLPPIKQRPKKRVKTLAREPFEYAGQSIAPGQRLTVELPIGTLIDHTPVTLPVHVIHGRKPGPSVLVCAAVHGDEIIGVEIIRRLLGEKALKNLRGTLLVVPIVNAFGFQSHSRYLPDRRDLNRVFPGSATGSLASQLAAIFLEQVVARVDLAIDLHSAAVHRTNLPQIRVSPDQPSARKLARAFGAPVYMLSKVLPGSLRESAQKIGIDMLLYEAGEALRYDETAIRVGLRGILRVLRSMEMLPVRRTRKAEENPKTLLGTRNRWTRAPHGGLLRAFKTIGDAVEEGELLGTISDPMGTREDNIIAAQTGLIIGRTNLPLVHRGDAVFHIVEVRSPDALEENIEKYELALQNDPLFDDDQDEII